MKISRIAFSAIIASATAQKGVQRLRSRSLKPEPKAKDKEPSLPEFPEMTPLSAAMSMDSMSASVSMSVPSIELAYEWDTGLEQFAFKDSSLSLSMSAPTEISVPSEPVKCDKKCKKEQMKAEEAADAQFAEWGAEALTPFAFDASLSFSMSMPSVPVEPIKCDKRCQKDKLKSRQRRRLSEAASLSMSMSLSADFEWAEPCLTAFEFNEDGSFSLSMSTP